MGRTKQTHRKPNGGKRIATFADYKATSPEKRTKLADVSTNKPLQSNVAKPTYNYKGTCGTSGGNQATTSQPSMDPTVKPVTQLRTKNGKYIWLKKGNIAQTQVDIIVNTTNSQLVLDQAGAVSNAILLAAGQQVQDECDLLLGRSYDNNQLTVPIGQFKSTGAGQMTRCKGIYHAVCPSYSTPNSQDILASLIYNLLIEAHNANMRSIAFPAIGTGEVGFPPHIIAKILCQEMVRFSNNCPQSSLYDLRLVIHWQDDNIYKAFQNELGVCTKLQQQDENTPKATKTTQPTPSTISTIKEVNSKGTCGTSIIGKQAASCLATQPTINSALKPVTQLRHKYVGTLNGYQATVSQPSMDSVVKPVTQMRIKKVDTSDCNQAKNIQASMDPTVKLVTQFRTKNGRHVWLKKGNIVQTQVDIIVNTTNSQLVLDQAGAVSNAILLTAGQQVQDECDLLVGRSYESNQLTVPIGQFKSTGAGQMTRCKGIYHAVCPPYSTPNSEGILASLIYNLLVEAHNKDMQSIAFPAIGTEEAGIPAHVIARILCQQIVRFSQQFPQSSLYDLRLVVQWHDDKVYKAFQYELGVCTKQQQQDENTAKGTKTTQPTPPIISTKPVKSNSKASTSTKPASTSTKPASTSTKPANSDTKPVKEDVITVNDSQDDPIIVLDSPGGSSSSQSSCSSSITLSGPSTYQSESQCLLMLSPGEPSWSLPTSQTSPKLGKAVTFGNYEYHQSWGTSQMWMELVSVQLTKGNLLEEEIDAIVVQTSDTFDLKGNMATAVLNKGGASIAQQCRWKSKSLLGSEKVVCTTAGSLGCGKIIFVALTDPSYVKQRTIDALKEAEREGVRSIAIPALGTGELGGVPSQIASDILDGIGEFVAGTNPQSVDRIKITILDHYVAEQFKPVFKAKIGKTYGFRKEKGAEGLGGTTGSPLKSFGSLEEEMYSQNDLLYDSEAMGTLNSAKLKQINACAAKHKVTVTTLPYGHGHRHVKSFRLEGPRLKVLYAKSDIQDLYLRLQKQYSEQKQAQKLCEGVQWKWLDKDENRYVSYDIDVVAELEKAFQEDLPFVQPPQLGKFRIDFVTMKEINLGGGLPVKETSVQRIAKKGAELRPDFPKTWGKMETTENLKIVDVASTSQEYQAVEAAFTSSLGGVPHLAQFLVPFVDQSNYSRVVKIQRIQNKELYRQYQARKEGMQLALNGIVDQIEHTLYHGTKAASCEAINRRGFNRSYQKCNAYGTGSYFAKDASYSFGYAVPDKAGHGRMYMCKVLTGEYTQGRQGMQVLPNKPRKKNEIYNSLVDNPNDPHIFVILHDTQAYPEYLITFC